jgi:hypothetical protein
MRLFVCCLGSVICCDAVHQEAYLFKRLTGSHMWDGLSRALYQQLLFYTKGNRGENLRSYIFVPVGVENVCRVMPMMEAASNSETS